VDEQSKGYRYQDKLAARAGLRTIKLKEASDSSGRIVAKAKGAGIGAPTTPVTFPVTAQLVNRDSGDCWESAFATGKRTSPEGDRRHQLIWG